MKDGAAYAAKTTDMSRLVEPLLAGDYLIGFMGVHINIVRGVGGQLYAVFPGHFGHQPRSVLTHPDALDEFYLHAAEPQFGYAPDAVYRRPCLSRMWNSRGTEKKLCQCFIPSLYISVFTIKLRHFSSKHTTFHR